MASPPLGTRKAPVIRRAPLRIYRILERLTCREFDGFCGRNLQRFTGPRVATGARRTLAGAEGAKADQLNTIAFSDGLRHDGDKRVNGLAGGGLACADGQCDSVNRRVAATHYGVAAPLERSVRVSPHSARAFSKPV